VIIRDGWPFILIGLALTVVFLLGALRWSSIVLLVVTAVFAVLTVFTAFFFRNPDRSIPPDPNLLVSPADGRIVAITHLDSHPQIDGPATRVSIFLSVFDVHVNRTPAAGTIDYVHYNPGKFFAAFEDKASELNEQTEIGMTTTGGHKIAFTQIAGLIARRIVCRLEPGQQVTAGELFGLIRFGSRTDLTVPAGWDIRVKIGDKVKGGESVIGVIPGGGLNQTASGDVSKTDVKL